VGAKQPGDSRADSSAASGYDYRSMLFGFVCHRHKHVRRDFQLSFYLAMSLMRARSRAAPRWTAEAAVPTRVFPIYEFLALFLIQIGVPTKPKASRIWFSRKRW
jgi:hypothetical protein